MGNFLSGVQVPLVVSQVLVYLAWVLALLILKRVGVNAIRRLAQHTKTRLDDIFVASIHWPALMLIFISGGFVISRLLPPEQQTAFLANLSGVFKAVTILAIVVFANNFLQGVLREYAPRIEALRDTSGIVRGMVRAVVFGFGLLILLDSFGVSITPIVASLGISSLAIALALQPTLENLFAGIQLVMDKPIQVGHFIRLESGEEGYVERIGWRTTWIRLPPNNMVILPNKNLVNAKILNYYYPDRETVVLVEVGVHYDSNLDRVEQVTLEVARQTLREVPEAVATFEPVVRFHTLGDFSVNMTVVLRVKEVTSSRLIKHEFIKRLHQRYAREGIVIPYPIRAVNMSQEKAAPVFAKND